MGRLVSMEATKNYWKFNLDVSQLILKSECCWWRWHNNYETHCTQYSHKIYSESSLFWLFVIVNIGSNLLVLFLVIPMWWWVLTQSNVCFQTEELDFPWLKREKAKSCLVLQPRPQQFMFVLEESSDVYNFVSTALLN